MKATELKKAEKANVTQQTVPVKKRLEIKIPKINGVWLLFWMNIKKIFMSKAVIAMGIVFVFMAVLFVTLSVRLEKESGIGSILAFIGYIFIMFFDIIFLTIVCISLIKTPMVEGITKIETRSGVAMWKTFSIRYGTYLIVAWFYTIIALIGMTMFAGSFDLQPLATKFYFYAPIVFLLLFPIIWFPVIALIALIFSVAAGTFMGIFTGAILAISPMISAMTELISTNNNEYMYSQAMDDANILKFGLSYSQNFYNLLKNDQNLGKIFTDDEQSAKILGTIEDNYFNNINMTSLGLIGLDITNDSGDFEQIMSRALLLGQFNIDTRTLIGMSNGSSNGNTDLDGDSETDEGVVVPTTRKTTLEGLAINDILLNIYNKVDEYFETNDRPTMLKPGTAAGYFNKVYYESIAYNIGPLSEWLGNKIPEYKSMFKFINDNFQKYNDLFFARSYYASAYFSSYEATSTKPNKINSVVDDDRIYEIYYRYPELMVLNSMIIQSWMSVMNISVIDPNNYSNIISNGVGNVTADKSWNAIVDIYNKRPTKASVDILRHFYILYEGLVSNQVAADAYANLSTVGLSTRGVLQSVNNFESLKSYSAHAYKSASVNGSSRNLQLQPMFAKNSISLSFGFQIWLAALTYLTIAIIATYLIYLLYSKKARI